jgi:hypothetical protein
VNREFSTDDAQAYEQHYPSVFHNYARTYQPIVPVIARSEATKQSSLVVVRVVWIASRSLSSGGALRRPGGSQ